MTKNALSKYLIIKPYLEQESSLYAISTGNGVAIRTLQRWVAQYRTKGLQNLDRKNRSDRGKYRKITDQTKGVIEGLFLHKKNITIANITRKLNEHCVEKNTAPANYYTVRKVVQSIPKDIATLAKYGNKAYTDKYEIIMRRESKYPNQMWQVDHYLLSIKVTHQDKAEYPWLTIIIDDFSRSIMGFCLYIGAPSAIQTALALRKAIWYKQDKNWSVCGIPETLYTDHGTDFTSTHIDYVCADLKIKLIHSIVAKPQGRGKVERFFLSLEQKLIELLKMNNKAYKLSELEEIIEDFVINDYQHSIHSTTGEAPIVLWNKHQIIPRMPDSIERLNLLLLTVKKFRTAQRDGIRFAGLRYFHPNLVAYVGECITVRFDPNDLGEIWVYEKNQLICKAVCEEFQDQSITYEELKKLRTRLCVHF
ncbi:MAG: Mu transposase C-terminal domain-containing protein [Rickettsiaceae bacterium]|nr:Mu transposase C-terminal domain-containing protein [Rickettsiaceae bacterium]